jgi:hypothetical protein
MAFELIKMNVGFMSNEKNATKPIKLMLEPLFDRLRQNGIIYGYG